MDLLVAALLIGVLLVFFAIAAWISYLVVFRGWRIYRPPSADASPGSNPGPAPANPGNPKPSGPRPAGSGPGASRPGTSRTGRQTPPRSRRQGRR